jgi:hypothetical protein
MAAFFSYYPGFLFLLSNNGDRAQSCDYFSCVARGVFFGGSSLMHCCVHGPIVWVVEGARLSRGDSAGGHDSGLGQEGWIGGRRGGAIGHVKREGVGRGGARRAIRVSCL